MSVDISDMLLFVNKLSELDLPESPSMDQIDFNELQNDEPMYFGEIFDGDVKVEKVRGV